MCWYGWMATAALGALMVGLVAALLPERWTRRVLAWMGVGHPFARNDRVRLPDYALVSAIAQARTLRPGYLRWDVCFGSVADLGRQSPMSLFTRLNSL